MIVLIAALHVICIIVTALMVVDSLYYVVQFERHAQILQAIRAANPQMREATYRFSKRVQATIPRRHRQQLIALGIAIGLGLIDYWVSASWWVLAAIVAGVVLNLASFSAHYRQILKYQYRMES